MAERNPWALLPEHAPFIAPEDRDVLDRHSQLVERLRLDLLPVPFMGDPDAEVVLLSRNPSAMTDDLRSGFAFVEERRR